MAILQATPYFIAIDKSNLVKIYCVGLCICKWNIGNLYSEF